MYKLYTISEDQIIAYKYYKSKKKTGPTIVFLHGLMSSIESSKAVALYDFCAKNDIDFFAFDNFGQGKSSGDFKKQTAGTWLRGLQIVLDEIITGDAILIGSSAGAWTALLGAMKCKRVKGLVCIAPAPDFTEMIWDNITETQKDLMKKEGYMDIKEDNDHPPIPISYKLIEESKEYLLLNKDKIKIDCPVHLIHGMQDKDVPYQISLQLLEKITSSSTVLKLIKDGNHSLSAPKFMQIIFNSLDEIIGSLETSDKYQRTLRF